QTTFGGVCGAKKDGLALHFGLESADCQYCCYGNFIDYKFHKKHPLKIKLSSFVINYLYLNCFLFLSLNDEILI
ncbi:hypothetical protein, partial [Providencia vermicola]|uniref:hypothetical protein n=1 Tax=Providencia vermicola TaxID=333965 RepID=UPI0034E47A37